MTGKPFMQVSDDEKFVRMVESDEPIPVQRAVILLTKALMVITPLAIKAGPEEPEGRIKLLPQ